MTSPSDCRTAVITLWMSSRVVQYSPRIHSADRRLLHVTISNTCYSAASSQLRTTAAQTANSQHTHSYWHWLGSNKRQFGLRFI